MGEASIPAKWILNQILVGVGDFAVSMNRTLDLSGSSAEGPQYLFDGFALEDK
jgi:hypothetical protein